MSSMDQTVATSVTSFPSRFKASVEQVLSVSTPAFLDSLRLSTFSLGTKAPHIDEVRTHTDTAEQISEKPTRAASPSVRIGDKG